MLSHVRILCDIVDCGARQVPLSMGFSRILEWIAISFSRGSSPTRDQTWVSCVSCIGSWILYHLEDYIWYLLINWWVSVVSTFWFLEIMLLWIFAQELLGGHKFSFLLGLCAGVELLGHTITMIKLLRTCQTVSQGRISPSCVWGFQSLSLLTNVSLGTMKTSGGLPLPGRYHIP